MKPDYEYIIEILNVFIESNKTNLRINDFDDFRKKDKNKFYFNILILRDKNILEGASDPRNIGIEFNGNNDSYDTWSVPWRLTADGQDFAKDILKPEIKETIISKFKSEGFSAIIDITKKLALKRTEKILAGVLDD
jgi:hypothetical protein